MTQSTVLAKPHDIGSTDDLLPSWLFAPLHREFARFLARRYGASKAVQLAAALTVRVLDGGNTCLNLTDFAGVRMEDETGDRAVEFPKLHEWKRELQASPAVAASTDQRRPLVLTETSLTLHRYRSMEQRLAGFFHRASEYQDVSITDDLISAARCLFRGGDGPSQPLAGGDLQCAGAFLPFFFRFAVITGGPGTGKTTVLARMLLLQCLAAHLAGAPLPEIVLAAPTGKAAQRMSDSLRKALGSDAVTRHIPREVIDLIEQATPLTIHRVLGMVPGKEPRKNSVNPLECDIAVLDECSMVDLLLMKKFVDALPKKSKLIILGDRDQLPSIEAGRVLADLCEWREINCFTGSFASVVNGVIEREGDHIVPNGEALSPIVELRHSYRFEGDKAIGVVASAVNRGDSKGALVALGADTSGDGASFCRLMDNPGREAVLDLICTLYQPLIRATDPHHALSALENAMVLTALNEGFLGRITINEAIERRFPGRQATPIIIIVNDPQRNLSNGDIGILFREGLTSKAWFAHLAEPLPLFNLPPYEKAFAITIHKSQGSEFKEVVVLPSDGGPLLSLELLYTAVTRARDRCTIVGKPETVKEAIGRRCDRRSGFGSELKHAGRIGGQKTELSKQVIMKEMR